jgi:hypothetical protein
MNEGNDKDETQMGILIYLTVRAYFTTAEGEGHGRKV